MNEEIRQEIIIKAEPGEIFKQLLLWGEVGWWPKKSLMQFSNLSGSVSRNTVYLQKVKLPFGPSWHTKNEVVDEKIFYIKRIFLDGIFKGFEELRILPQSTPKVTYTFNCRIKNFFDRLIWKVLFKKLHTKNIALILKSLKNYLE